MGIRQYPAAKKYYENSINAMKASVINMQSSEQLLQIQIQYADVLHKLGESDKAIELINDALTKFPSLATGHLHLATIYADKNDLANANRSVETLETIWQNADVDYLEYKKLEKVKVKIQKLTEQTAEAA